MIFFFFFSEYSRLVLPNDRTIKHVGVWQRNQLGCTYFLPRKTLSLSLGFVLCKYYFDVYLFIEGKEKDFRHVKVG